MMGRWSQGIWLGIREESGEAMVGCSEGVMKASTVRRKSVNEDIGKREYLDEMTTLPWNVGKDEDRDVDIRIEVPGQDE